MSVPIFGINIPAPSIKIDQSCLEKYADLYKGIRDRKDTVTWRTLIISIREILGISNADFTKISRRQYLKASKFIKQLVNNTYLQNLTLEIEHAVGIEHRINKSGIELDALLFSGRHHPEPILWTLADYYKSKGKNVAVVNPVGHYNDGQTRVVGPFKYFHKIKKLVILASTQNKLGGSIDVLSNVIRLLRNPDLAKTVQSVEVVIPMFGGSRGHKFGQSEEVGFEVMEASFNAKILSLLSKDILSHLSEEISQIPKIRFSSIDIHNSEYPTKTFNEEGFDFISIKTSSELAGGILKLLKLKSRNTPVILVACDKGSVWRTEELAKALLFSKEKSLTSLRLIYIDKQRSKAGFVTTAEIVKINNWKIVSGIIKKVSVKVSKKPVFKSYAVIYSDDMIDTGGTAEHDLKFISTYYPNTSLKLFVASHPIFSKGYSAIKKIGADYFILGNTLSWEDLEDVRGVEIADFAPAIYSVITEPKKIASISSKDELDSDISSSFRRNPNRKIRKDVIQSP